MQKALLAAAVMATAFGNASAQQVTLYGRVDLTIAQRAGQAKNLEIRNGSGSRFGLKGSEDLGGGLAAVFGLEHRFSADTGAAGSTFWEGKSVVGLKGGFGQITLGRDDNPTRKLVQEKADPWAGDTVAGNGNIYDGNIGSSRYGNAITYRGKFGPVVLGAQITEGDGLADRPMNLALAYQSGPIYAAIGHDNPGNANDAFTSVMARYDFGAFQLSGLYGSGQDASDRDVTSYLLAGTARVGAGQLRASYGVRKNQGVANHYKQFGLGYHYPLSKRTTVYGDIANVKPVSSGGQATGYDLGIRHNF